MTMADANIAQKAWSARSPSPAPSRGGEGEGQVARQPVAVGRSGSSSEILSRNSKKHSPPFPQGRGSAVATDGKSREISPLTGSRSPQLKSHSHGRNSPRSIWETVASPRVREVSPPRGWSPETSEMGRKDGTPEHSGRVTLDRSRTISPGVTLGKRREGMQNMSPHAAQGGWVARATSPEKKNASTSSQGGEFDRKEKVRQGTELVLSRNRSPRRGQSPGKQRILEKSGSYVGPRSPHSQGEWGAFTARVRTSSFDSEGVEGRKPERTSSPSAGEILSFKKGSGKVGEKRSGMVREKTASKKSIVREEAADIGSEMDILTAVRQESASRRSRREVRSPPPGSSARNSSEEKLGSRSASSRSSRGRSPPRGTPPPRKVIDTATSYCWASPRVSPQRTRGAIVSPRPQGRGRSHSSSSPSPPRLPHSATPLSPRSNARRTPSPDSPSHSHTSKEYQWEPPHSPRRARGSSGEKKSDEEWRTLARSMFGDDDSGNEVVGIDYGEERQEKSMCRSKEIVPGRRENSATGKPKFDRDVDKSKQPTEGDSASSNPLHISSETKRRLYFTRKRSGSFSHSFDSRPMITPEESPRNWREVIRAPSGLPPPPPGPLCSLPPHITAPAPSSPLSNDCSSPAAPSSYSRSFYSLSPPPSFHATTPTVLPLPPPRSTRVTQIASDSQFSLVVSSESIPVQLKPRTPPSVGLTPPGVRIGALTMTPPGVRPPAPLRKHASPDARKQHGEVSQSTKAGNDGRAGQLEQIAAKRKLQV